MAVFKSSGSIRPSEIRNFFGGSSPDRITEYYRGGNFVENISPNDSIPTSGTIRFSDFYSTGNDFPQLTDRREARYESSQPLPTIAGTAGFRFQPNGDLEIVEGPGDGSVVATVANEWLRNKRSGAGSDWDIRASLAYGSLQGGGSDSLNTWLSLSTARYWRIKISDADNTTGATTAQAGLIIEIRDRSNVQRLDWLNPVNGGNLEIYVSLEATGSLV